MDPNSSQSPSPAESLQHARGQTPLIVLDTNVVLDWLVFHDPSSGAFSAAIERRQVRWIATQAMRDELAHVLGRGLAARQEVDQALVLGRWDAFAEVVAEPARLPAHGALHCSDPDDQQFLDLARARDARWLLSRDRAVLRLARRAARVDLHITVPAYWDALG